MERKMGEIESHKKDNWACDGNVSNMIRWVLDNISVRHRLEEAYGEPQCYRSEGVVVCFIKKLQITLLICFLIKGIPV